MKWCLALALCASLAAADAPHLYYSKSFPNSTPPFVAVNLDKNGAGDYKEAENDDNPVHFQLSPAETSEIFGLVEKLGYFDHPLESGLKVAFMGTKTFRYTNGSRTSEVKFNFSEDPSAQALGDWFDRISESEQLLTSLEVSAKYDKLGIDKAVLMLEIAYDHKRLVALPQYLPLLDRVARNESYIHQARLRAAALAEQFRAVK
ncbi:MAG TPA: hypothetical protein VMI94_20310 [Bryobacteraceae bacterium]|nr:hypothetical protein [Bryobacteraceae bacterium]